MNTVQKRVHIRALDVLKDARDYLSDRAHWTQGAYKKPSVNGSGARYCAYGAIDAMTFGRKGAGARTVEMGRDYLTRAAYDLFPRDGGVININDSTRFTPDKSYKRVLRMYDKAIELLTLELQS